MATDPQSLSSFLGDLDSRILNQFSQRTGVAEEDEDLKYFTTPAANAIEWVVSPEYLNFPSVYDHWRQYQIIRDFFQLRCPLPSCNDQSKDAKDPWGKSKEYLKAEKLLIWDGGAGEDVCPNCESTRSELIQDGLLANYLDMLLVCGMRCIPGYESVLTDKGFVRLDSLWYGDKVKDTFRPISLNVINNGTPEAASDVYYAGKAEVIKLGLVKGINIVGSKIHPIWSMKDGQLGWHRLNDLAIGDLVHVNSGNWPDIDNYNLDNKILTSSLSRMMVNVSRYKLPNIWSTGLAHILGYLVSEGQCNRKYGVRFTNGNKQTLRHFSDTCNNIFNIRPKCYESTGQTVDLNGIGIRELLRGLGLDLLNAHYKRIPESLWSAPKDIVSAFLSAYFEGDGTAAVDNHGGKPVVACYTVSKDLANDLIKMLWALDIRASLTATKSRKFSSKEKFDHNAYSIRIYGQEILKFATQIGFLSDKKRAALDRCVNRVLSTKFKDRSDFLKIKTKVISEPVDLYDLHVPGSHSFSTGIVTNHNSGKSTVAAILGTYIEHRMLTIGHATQGGLAKFFDQAPRQSFDITFIASTDTQSIDTIWAKYVGLRAESPWLQKYIKWIKTLQSEQGTQVGSKNWEYDELKQSVVHGYLNLKIASYNSNSSGLAGRTRISAFVDELSRFENTDGRRGAEEAYRVLENSLYTIRANKSKNKMLPWLGNMLVITSPISADDKAMTLLKDAPKAKSLYWGHYATWDFNPFLPRSTFDELFEKDPIGAQRDFGASPPTVASPLITDIARFRELAIQSDLQPTATLKKILYTDRTGREYISAQVDSAKLARNADRYICYDASSSFDQFAGACAHGEWVATPEGRQMVTVYDWVFRLIPEAQPRRDIWFDFVIKAIEHLAKYTNIARVEFDRWQSTSLIQAIRNLGIHAEMKGTTGEQFTKFLSDVNMSLVRMLPPLPTDAQMDPPNMSAQGVAFYELEHLERSVDLNTVANPKKGMRRGWDSDDVALCVVHVNDMVQGSVVNISNSNSRQMRLRREQSGSSNFSDIGRIFRGRGGMGGGSSRGW